MQKTHTLALLAIGLVMVLATGCTSYKQVPYIQNSREVDLTASKTLFDARIMPKDMLLINVVYPEDQTAADVFNLSKLVSTNNTTTTQNFSQQSQSYIVTNEGTIEFPLLGELKVIGKTKGELEEYIAGLIQGRYLKNRPIVNVSMSNYKVAVLGEVNSPGVKTVTNGKVNILEAIAMAGDLSIYGRRQDVKLIREDQYGEKSIVELDLTDANIINSPYYQLQQNDIVYVTPNKVKTKSADLGAGFTIWFTCISMVITITNFIINMTD